MSERADRELVQLAQQGDPEAIGELFLRYWRAARATAFGITGDAAAAEDAASEAFRQALTGLKGLRDPDRFGYWLRTVVVREARSGLRNRNRALSALPPDLPDPADRADGVLQRLELTALIRQATGSLPPSLREATMLVYFEGYSAEAAARFLGIPDGTLRRRLHDGRSRIRSSVEQALQGRINPMNEGRDRQIQTIRGLFGNGEVYQALRASLALRPAPGELIREFLGQPETLPLPEAAGQLLLPSVRATDAADPVGAIALSIRQALPEHPPVSLRASRALLRLTGTGRTLSMAEHLLDSPDEHAFQRASGEMRVSHVLDLNWTAGGPLESRSVQEILERLCAAVLPGVGVRFAPYDEPRYRSALQLHLNDVPARAAYGGVLAAESAAAHLRIFLEPWASASTGRTIEFEALPRESSIARKSR